MQTLTEVYEKLAAVDPVIKEEVIKQASELEKLAEEEDAAGRIMARGFADELQKIAVDASGLAAGQIQADLNKMPVEDRRNKLVKEQGQKFIDNSEEMQHKFQSLNMQNRRNPLLPNKLTDAVMRRATGATLSGHIDANERAQDAVRSSLNLGTEGNKRTSLKPPAAREHETNVQLKGGKQQPATRTELPGGGSQVTPHVAPNQDTIGNLMQGAKAMGQKALEHGKQMGKSISEASGDIVNGLGDYARSKENVRDKVHDMIHAPGVDPELRSSAGAQKLMNWTNGRLDKINSPGAK